MSDRPASGSVVSADGTAINYLSLGEGPGLILVGGVLASASSYLPLAEALAPHFTVHVMNRRGRAPSGPQRPGHSIDDERADLLAVASATAARRAFGHSFGGLVVLETARRHPVFDEIYVYEPGVSIGGSLNASWLGGYRHLLEAGDHRGAFATMVKNAGHAPAPLAALPLRCVNAILRLGIRGERWSSIDALLDANLGEQAIVAALDDTDTTRFSTITAHTHLLGGEKSPAVVSRRLLDQLVTTIPHADASLLPRLRHAGPMDHPLRVADAVRSLTGSDPANGWGWQVVPSSP